MKHNIFCFAMLMILAFGGFDSLYPQTNIYIERWPTISHDRVNIRNFPSTTLGSVSFQLNAGEKIIIRNRTIEQKEVNGMVNYWYYISVFEGEHRSRYGWVFGEYVRFTGIYDIDYWNASPFVIRPIDERSVYKNIVASEIFSALGLTNNFESYDLAMLERHRPMTRETSFIWYMHEAGYETLNTYLTNYGIISGFVNEETREWRFLSVTIHTNIQGSKLYPGMTIAQLEELFGTDYTIEGPLLQYDFQDLFDSYYWVFEIEDNIIKSFTIYLYYT